MGARYDVALARVAFPYSIGVKPARRASCVRVARSRLAEESDGVLFLFVGRCCWPKVIYFLLRAFGVLWRQRLPTDARHDTMSHVGKHVATRTAPPTPENETESVSETHPRGQ